MSPPPGPARFTTLRATRPFSATARGDPQVDERYLYFIATDFDLHRMDSYIQRDTGIERDAESGEPNGT